MGRPKPAGAQASLTGMLEALAARAWRVEFPAGRRGAGADAAVHVDRLLVRVARGHGALDVALGECLAAMAAGDRVLRLGYAGLGDYAREVLGIEARTALAMARLARELAERPLLQAAVRRGEVSPRLAQALLPVARGEAEAGWVARATQMTVREAEAAVKREGLEGEAPEEGWERVELRAAAEIQEKVEEALDLAGRLLGPTAPRWQRLEAVCQEYLGAHAAPGGEDEGEGGGDEEGGGNGDGVGAGPGAGPGVGPGRSEPADELLDSLMAALEEETGRWEALDKAEPVEAPRGVDDGDVRRIDRRLRELAGMRDRWDDLVGHLGLVVQVLGLWRRLGFASFGHYCAERLGMAERTVAQRVWLERKLHELPGLRGAMRDGRLSYEKARLVAGVAAPRDVRGWISIAERSTCVELRRKVEAGEIAQMCAREKVSVLVPRRVAGLFDEACRAVMHQEGRWMAPGDCLGRLCEHFVAAWESILERRDTPQRRAIERDRGFCQVPGCSRAAVHAHHVLWRSRGGSDEPENLVSLCAGHHLHGIHAGYIRVSGRAPDQLKWEVAAGPPAS